MGGAIERLSQQFAEAAVASYPVQVRKEWMCHSEDYSAIVNGRKSVSKMTPTASVIDAMSAESPKRWQYSSGVMVCSSSYTLKPFIANAVVAMWQMRWHGHVAHGISQLYHSVSVSM